MFSIKKLFVLIALHHTAAGVTPTARVSQVRSDSFASLVNLSRKDPGDMWLTKQADLILTAIEHNTVDLTPEQRISCIQAMHNMIGTILETVENRPDVHIHRMATILEAARGDRDAHPAQFSHELLIANIALRFLDEVGMDILGTFPGLVPDPTRQKAIGRILRVMHAMGYSFNQESQIGQCSDLTALFFDVLTKSTTELVSYADHLQIAFEGMNALTLESGLTVKWSYGPMALSMFYCIPALSEVPTETRLTNMGALSGLVGDEEADILSQRWALILRDLHMTEFTLELMQFRPELASAIALSAIRGAESLESAALNTVSDFYQLIVRRPEVMEVDHMMSIRARLEIADLVHSIQSAQNIQPKMNILQARINAAAVVDNEAPGVPIPALVTPASLAQIPATSGVLVRIRNSLSLWINTPGSHTETWLTSITGDLLVHNAFSANQLVWLDNFLDKKILSKDPWIETACYYRRFLGIGIFDHADIPITNPNYRERLVPRAKKLCSNLLYTTGVRDRDEFLTRQVFHEFTMGNLETVSDEMFQYTLAYKEFQADPDWFAGNAAVGFLPNELLNAYLNPDEEGTGFREFLGYQSALYGERALRRSNFPLEIRARIAAHARPWKEFEPLIKRFDEVYRTHGTKILINLRDFTAPSIPAEDLNLNSKTVIGRAHRIFSRAFRSLTVLGFLGDNVPVPVLRLKPAVLRFLEAYVAFLERVSQVEITSNQDHIAWKSIMNAAIDEILGVDRKLWNVATEGHAASGRTSMSEYRDLIAHVVDSTRLLSWQTARMLPFVPVEPVS